MFVEYHFFCVYPTLQHHHTRYLWIGLIPVLNESMHIGSKFQFSLSFTLLLSHFLLWSSLSRGGSTIIDWVAVSLFHTTLFSSRYYTRSEARAILLLSHLTQTGSPPEEEMLFPLNHSPWPYLPFDFASRSVTASGFITITARLDNFASVSASLSSSSSLVPASSVGRRENDRALQLFPAV